MKPSQSELQKHLKDILELPERVKKYDVVLKKELLLQVENNISNILGSINNLLLANQSYQYPKEYLPNKQFQYWVERVSQFFNYYELQFLKEIITNSLRASENSPAGDLIFLNNDLVNSEAFFKYLVNEWLIKEPNKKTALKHITFKLWHRNTNQNKEVRYRITSTLSDFAVYWNSNDNMSKLFRLNTNNPKLNEPDKTTNQYYENKFMHYLNEYTRV